MSANSELHEITEIRKRKTFTIPNSLLLLYATRQLTRADLPERSPGDPACKDCLISSKHGLAISIYHFKEHLMDTVHFDRSQTWDTTDCLRRIS